MVDEDIIDAAHTFFISSFEGVIRIEVLDATFALWIDGRGTGMPLISRDPPADLQSHFCLWRVDYIDLMPILREGARRLEASFITGRLAISGDMGVMARLEIGDG
ncbi:hypothetical protein PB2503_10889 [Parvularcula bermudensis HTCC2503]|uniref:SCP2 domain-containing protein n=1 Tax=Parvularcula bermudensis (strain ATCC BAA-594 / HTCC2503 / KCTC 12087) TaxID=314260 RepID=E0THT2_PARBH|nr:SCP2 sterol-binding domain-containing protein [Parvularcula bermudensis]ADM10225.1 hypothetical protein PB2503_10889 [Parvularcula bermudensis HTCC2503]